ncbi:MAG TPA: hypothetical protein VFD75_07650, partial [Pyrinomonadaceae bacterium]|nr:hypothetical protein [Pyrinomonadaceae bacterium]
MKIQSSCLKPRLQTGVLILLLTSAAIAQQPKPLPAPARFRPLLGEYVHDNQTVIVLESEGKLYALAKGTSQKREITPTLFSHNQLTLDNVIYKRQPLGPEPGATQLKVTPLRPVPELIKEALAAQPPQETGDFLPTD